jgi:predicted secreted protein
MQNKSIVLFLSPCLLNQNLRAHGLTQHPEIKKKISKIAKKYNAKIERLPCPEFLLLGEREPKTYDEYVEIAGFKDLCEKLAEEVSNTFKKFKKCNIVIVGIARSPSCSVSYVYDRDNNLKKGEGLFIQFLRNKTSGHAIFAEIDYRQIDVSIEKIKKILKNRF